PEGEPVLGVAIHQDAGRVRIHPNEFLADSMRAIDAAEQAFEFVVRDRLLEFFERVPLGRVGQWIAQAIRGERGEAEKDKKEKGAEAKDHGLEFRLFNTMLDRC